MERAEQGFLRQEIQRISGLQCLQVFPVEELMSYLSGPECQSSKVTLRKTMDRKVKLIQMDGEDGSFLSQ